MITRRKLFGLLAGAPFVSIAPAAPVSVGANFAKAFDRGVMSPSEVRVLEDMTVRVTWDAVPSATRYRLYGRPGGQYR